MIVLPFSLGPLRSPFGTFTPTGPVVLGRIDDRWRRDASGRPTLAGPDAPSEGSLTARLVGVDAAREALALDELLRFVRAALPALHSLREDRCADVMLARLRGSEVPHLLTGLHEETLPVGALWMGDGSLRRTTGTRRVQDGVESIGRLGVAAPCPRDGIGDDGRSEMLSRLFDRGHVDAAPHHQLHEEHAPERRDWHRDAVELEWLRVGEHRRFDRMLRREEFDGQPRGRPQRDRPPLGPVAHHGVVEEVDRYGGRGDVAPRAHVVHEGCPVSGADQRVGKRCHHGQRHEGVDAGRIARHAMGNKCLSTNENPRRLRGRANKVDQGCGSGFAHGAFDALSGASIRECSDLPKITTVACCGLLPPVTMPDPSRPPSQPLHCATVGAEVNALLARIKASLPELEKLRSSVTSGGGDEDGLFRFYIQHTKVVWLQSNIRAIVEALQNLAPKGGDLHPWFRQIVAEGMGNVSDDGTIDDWPEQARRMVEAHHHARYFLVLACKYGRELKAAPECPEFGWGAVLELYGLGERWP